MHFKIQDVNGFCYNVPNRAFVRLNHEATIFKTFKQAAALAARHKLYGPRHEPCAVIIQPCDKEGNTL